MSSFMHTSPLRISVAALLQDDFEPYGTVIENPLPFQHPSSAKHLPSNAVIANQGSALKFLDITQMTNLYDNAPSGKPSKVVVNMFSCAARELRVRGGAEPVKVPVSVQCALRQNIRKTPHFLDVAVLERHPFTSQTFIPLGLSPTDSSTSYLVIVAPSLRSGGPPDLTKTRAFLARGNQAVTYAAGTWHAPMVVLGLTSIDFVVVQFANGVAEEDCQEISILSAHGVESGLAVVIELPEESPPLTADSKGRL